MKIPPLKEWYIVAGRDYGWTKDGFAQIGIGIKARYIKDNSEVEFMVGKGGPYFLDTSEARKFIIKYNSKFITKDGTLLGVVSRSLLKTKKEEKEKIKKVTKIKQLTMF